MYVLYFLKFSAEVFCNGNLLGVGPSSLEMRSVWFLAIMQDIEYIEDVIDSSGQIFILVRWSVDVSCLLSFY